MTGGYWATNLITVAPREGRVSRNFCNFKTVVINVVAPREGRVSRNSALLSCLKGNNVAPREGRVSRNLDSCAVLTVQVGRAPRGACE